MIERVQPQCVSDGDRRWDGSDAAGDSQLLAAGGKFLGAAGDPLFTVTVELIPALRHVTVRYRAGRAGSSGDKFSLYGTRSAVRPARPGPGPDGRNLELGTVEPGHPPRRAASRGEAASLSSTTGFKSRRFGMPQASHPIIKFRSSVDRDGPSLAFWNDQVFLERLVKVARAYRTRPGPYAGRSQPGQQCQTGPGAPT
eukprot:757537-Hanusia_phi.AAC.5